MFVEGQRQREYSAKDILPLSGRLIPEFDGRRNIRDMFTRKPSTPASPGIMPPIPVVETAAICTTAITPEVLESRPDLKARLLANKKTPTSSAVNSTDTTSKKRSGTDPSTSRSLKRIKSGSSATAPTATGKGQQSLKGFFKPKATIGNRYAPTGLQMDNDSTLADEKQAFSISTLQTAAELQRASISGPDDKPNNPRTSFQTINHAATTPLSKPGISPAAKVGPSTPELTCAESQSQVHDPVASAESWSKLFTKPVAPRCEGHDEPCNTLLTKKSGMNCGRSFWMCPRPLGPSGAKEKNTQWRCQTFIWCSDWNPASS